MKGQAVNGGRPAFFSDSLRCQPLIGFYPADQFIPLPFVARIVVLVLVFWIGGMAATRGEQILGYKDPGEIVIDELLGMWLVLLPFSNPGWAKIGIAFVLFRIFDMWKPWPVHASESWLPGGYGIMIDDVMAGLQALLVMWLLQLVGFWGV